MINLLSSYEIPGPDPVPADRSMRLDEPAAVAVHRLPDRVIGNHGEAPLVELTSIIRCSPDGTTTDRRLEARRRCQSVVAGQFFALDRVKSLITRSR